MLLCCQKSLNATHLRLSVCVTISYYHCTHTRKIRENQSGIPSGVSRTHCHRVSGGEYHGRGRRRKCRTSLFGSPLTEEGRARLGLREKPLRVGEYSARLRDLCRARLGSQLITLWHLTISIRGKINPRA